MIRTKKQSERTGLMWRLNFQALLVACIIIMAPVASIAEDVACLDCHDGFDQSLAGSLHELNSGSGITISCGSCHTGGNVHADDPTADNIGNPATLFGDDANRACESCHAAHVGLDNYGFDAHSNEQLNCTSCHQVHGSGASALLDDDAAFCGKCHGTTANEFVGQSIHPLGSGNVTCLSCHQFTNRQNDNHAYDLSQTCIDCHPEQGGPFPYEHSAIRAYAVDGAGCVACHSPHASASAGLLKIGTTNMCQQCHVVPGHQIAHGGAYNTFDCGSCHTEIHGSYFGHSLLDPDLPTRFGVNCYQSGCHSLSGGDQ